MTEGPRQTGSVRASLAVVATVLALMAQHLLTTTQPLDRPVLAIAVVLYGVAIASFLALASGSAETPRPEPEGVSGSAGMADTPRPGPEEVSGSAGTAMSPTPADRRGRMVTARRAAATVETAALGAPVRAAAAVIALAGGLLVIAELFVRGDEAESYFDVFGLWLAAIALYVLAFVWPGSLTRWRQVRCWARRHREPIVDAGLLTAGALVLRVLFVGSVPNVLGGDEALVGLVARGLLENTGNMFSTMFAYSNVYHLAVAGFVAVLGSTATAIRILCAVLSALAVPLTYFAGRELFGRRVGLVAGVLLLASHQHIHMSRTGHAHGVDAFVVAWVLLAFSRGFRRRSLSWMAVAGVGLGAAQYVYVGARSVDLVVAAFVVLMAVLDRTRLRRSLSGVAVAFGASVVTAGPMIAWAVRRPGDYLTRLNQTGLVQSGAAEDRLAEGMSLLHLVRDQLYHAFLAPIAYPTASFYDARLPMLDLLWACLFVLGLALAVRRFRDWRYLLLLVTFVGTSLAILALGNLVTASNYRVTGALPVYALLAGVALVLMVERGLSGSRLREPLPVLVAAAVVAVIAGYNVGYYFLDHVPNCGYMANDDGTSAVSLAATFIAEQADDAIVFVVTAPSYFVGSYPNGEYLTDRKMAFLGSPDNPQPGDPGAVGVMYDLPVGSDLQVVVAALGDARPALFWVSPFAEGNLRIGDIEALLPGGTLTTLSRCDKELVQLYTLP